MLFLERLHRNCLNHGSKTAIEFRGEGFTERISYDSLWHRTTATAAWLEAQGVCLGDRVAVCLPKSLSAIQLHLAACRMGAVSMPLNPAYSEPELKYLLEDSGAKVLVTSGQHSRNLETGGLGVDSPARVVAVDPDRFHRSLPAPESPLDKVKLSHDSPALMLYTSGTTGHPKGALMSHGSLTANIDMLGQAWQWSADDVLLHVLPMFHVHGLLVALHGALHAGASAIVRPSFDASTALRDLSRTDCTVFMAVPTMYRRLLAALGGSKADLRHMRLLTSGSDRLPVEVFEAIEERLGHRVVERYGMTETGIMLSNPVDGARIAGQVGVPLPGVEMRIVGRDGGVPCHRGEVGELQTRGPHLFLGYWNDPDKTSSAFTEDGWFRTGDLGTCDSSGRFELKGRMTELMITGGFNVYPTEVEHVLARHAGVAQCAVAGVPDDDWGQAVTAFVVRSDGSTSTEELIQHCRTSLAAYKSPKRVVFVDALPRNAMGKVQKQVLVAGLAEKGLKQA
jgi:malonyl-CoA/methylmalonyl-CoA synthetase